MTTRQSEHQQLQNIRGLLYDAQQNLGDAIRQLEQYQAETHDNRALPILDALRAVHSRRYDCLQASTNLDDLLALLPLPGVPNG